MASDIKLLSCPFCGGEAILDREDIFCDYCHLSMKIDDRLYNREAENYEEARTQAIEAWNTRKPMDRIVEKLEEMKGNPPELQYRHLVVDECISIVRGGKDET